ncbi:hypothetical protein KCTC52924_02669 [Arenibacter antarcticus]|uniref:SusD/RagB family nutrient-binding outer membrane lipoprotein n=1 Tax=Arenibacter antarcticus TaxID=2040469 RepID=A0ABW5VI33_9FLAO|nr:SusD/RagB family nutrient-binding outer membrane lipoprotein [Arenibacter sp. H213]MCM4167092.1 SusD/RagB family nutrient-binding outer membrane lipoprotein [Arenibacter sp. H213]
MKTLKIILSILLISSLGGCKKYDDYQSDPNRTTEGDPGLLLTNIQVSVSGMVTLSAAMSSRQMVNTDGSDNNQYYGWQRAGFGNYNMLRQVLKMEEEAKLIDNTNYLALGKFFRAWLFLSLTNTFGDVPYSKALQGELDAFTPAYDRQEDIYLAILNDLKEANNMISADNGIVNGDVIYGGDLEKWKKAINSLSLRTLISLSRKEGNTKIGVINRFQEIVGSPAQYPIFTSNADSFALPYYEIDGNEYPYFNSNSIKTAYYFEESFVNMLKGLEDPRLFTFADREFNGKDLPEDDFNAYGGLGGSDLLSDNTGRLSNGEGSPIDSRYYDDPENEPAIGLGYAEIEFTLAEAAARGWIGNDPEDHYKKGIVASMLFYDFNQATIDAYLQKNQVQYLPQQGVEMIITQKYISFFMNSGWELFYNQRRTGFPEFATDGGGILNGGQIPKRWMYPESEIIYNNESLQAAISQQFPEGDNVNGEMWLLKTE